jgi:hypothetical protein
MKLKTALNRLFYLFVILAVTACMGAGKLPSGWRFPSDDEINQDWRKDNPQRFLVVKADLNGDGAQDEARILVKEGKRHAALVAFMSEGKSFRTYFLLELDLESLEDMGIEVAEKGNYETACGIGFFPCRPGEPEKIILNFPAIKFFKFDSSYSFFYWTKENGSFEHIWIVD